MAQMEGQAEQVPEQMKPFFQLVLKKMKERVAQLESAGGAE
jgi:hypothetical protein